MKTDWTTDVKGTGQYAEVNGINLYFETHGAGRPLILLHGGLGSGEMFGPIMPALTERHQVIAVDLQGHGRTADIDRPIDIRMMADDIAALIDHLGLDKPDVVGYSLGGGVAFFTASRYPEKVRKLVMASANIRQDAIPDEMRAQQKQVNAAAAEFMKDTPMYQLYQRVAPHPEDFGTLLDKIGAYMDRDSDLYREALEIAEKAERLGFDSLWTSEHHFADDAYAPSLLTLSAAIAARTQTIRVGTGLVLAPLYHPLRLAEDAAVVDLISGGRLVLGLGLGWLPREFEALGIPFDERASLIERAIRTCQQAWGSGLVEGPGVSVEPKPARAGGPPIWVRADHGWAV